MLTLQDKLQLFKLAKKPRKQIRLRLEVITNSLNLPSLHKTYKLLETTSEKHQKVSMNISNFKKIDKTKHNMTGVCRTEEDEVYENEYSERRLVDRNSLGGKENARKTVNLGKIKGKSHVKDKSNRLYHSNNNTQFLLKDFDFNLSREQKKQKMEEENILRARENFSYLQKEKAKQSWALIKLKNELSGLKNMNKVYRGQLENAKRVEKIAWNANRMSKLLMKTDDAKDGSVNGK